MSPDYIQKAIAPSGLSERKWRLVRQQCRTWAKERGEDVLQLYAREKVLTPREAETLADPEKAFARERWRTDKMRLRAENKRLRAALEKIAGGKKYADDPWGIARTALAEQEKK